ncbi:MAG: hypothetical protein EA423_10740 [Phycisphaerales bacterium]|nr:MAG: hypothetical protein EA423_10740 [Phycisphaerales bacterium]
MQRFGAVCAAGVVAAAGLAQGQVEVIYAGDPESGKTQVPGRPHLNFRAPLASFQQLAHSSDRTRWTFRAFAPDASNTTIDVIMSGSGTTGEAFISRDDSADFLPNFTGWAFFDSDIGIANDGRVYFGYRAEGGTVTNANNEGIAVYNPTTNEFTDLVNGADIAPGAMISSGNGNFGNSLRVTSVTGNDNAIIYAGNLNVGFNLNRGVWLGFPLSSQPILQIGTEVAPNDFLRTIRAIGTSSALSADGTAWAHLGAIRFGENPFDPIFQPRDVLYVSGNIEIEAGDIIGGQPVDALTAITMSDNGTWFVIGRFENGDSFASQGTDLLLRSGDPVPGGATDEVVDSIATIKGYDNGDRLWILNTTGPAGDSRVVVLNDTVLARQGDPIDLNGNGQFDNDSFLRTISANNIFLGADDLVYAIINIEAGDGTNRGNAFVRMATDPAPTCPADLNGDGVVDADDFFLFLSLFAAGDPRADINNDGVIDADDFFAYLTLFAAGC